MVHGWRVAIGERSSVATAHPLGQTTGAGCRDVSGTAWNEICSFANLCRSARRAARGKRHVRGTAAFLERLEPACLDLSRRLVEESWRPSRPTVFVIRDPQLREISAAPFEDRVVHHALVDPLEERFDAALDPRTFACRRGKGTLRAIEHARALVRTRSYFLKLDVAPLRSRLPVREPCLPQAARAARHRMQHEPSRELLRQRRDRELLWNLQAGMGPSTPVVRAHRCAASNARRHRGLLQPPTAPFGAWVQDPGRGRFGHSLMRTSQPLGSRLPLDTLLGGLRPRTAALRSSQLERWLRAAPPEARLRAALHRRWIVLLS